MAILPTGAIHVSFIGGPFDGHRQRTDDLHLRPTVYLPVYQRLIGSLSGDEESNRDETVTGLARYDLERRREVNRYVFRGKCPVDGY